MKNIWESKYVRVYSLEDIDAGCAVILSNKPHVEAAARCCTNDLVYGYTDVLPYGYTFNRLFSEGDAIRLAHQISSAAGRIKQGTFRLSPKRAFELHNGSGQSLEAIPPEEAPFYLYFISVPGPILGEFPGGRLGYELD